MKRTPLRRISAKRLLENDYYLYRRKRFLDLHPYCQVWLREHDIAEADALGTKGRVVIAGRVVSIPLATQVHHSRKRRGANLLAESGWLALSREAHERIESDKDWARLRGYLENF